MVDNIRFMLGANYWSSKWGTEMWLHYNSDEIREDLKKLSEFGVKNLRIFPNWRDFQPVDEGFAWQGRHGEYVNANTGEPVTGDGVDMDMIANFRDFCSIAEEYGIELVVSIVTGWMSGKLFTPPVIKGKNLISNPEALMWMRKFIKRFVRELKDKKNIVMWGLGNECNCLGFAKNRYEAYQWTSTVADAIRTEDRSRPIASDMHALASDIGETEDNQWFLEDQGELTDVLCTHPYPSPTVGGDIEPYNRFRTALIPTAQTLYYAGVSGKPAYIQESGTLTQTIGNREMSSDFMRIQILSSIAHGFAGYQWWCAWEQKHLDFPPYTWSMIERELGLFDNEKNPKPVAYVMKEMSSLLDKLPKRLPQRKLDGICLLSRGQNRQNMAIASVTLGKQAGVELDVAYSNTGNIPDSKLYFMPCITGWQVIYKKTWTTLLEKIEKGATLYISFDGGQITDFPDVVGAESMGFMSNSSHRLSIDGEEIPYTCREILLNPKTAEVIFTNEEGNPVLLKNKYGKGSIYFLNLPMERIVYEGTNLYETLPFYKIYREVAKNVIQDKIITASNKGIGVTINPLSENKSYVTLLNYSHRTIVPQISLKDGWKIKETIYGDIKEIPPCNGVFIKIGR